MELRTAARSGVRWTTVAGLATGILGVLQALILVRLLNADEFGAMAASMVVVGLAQRFSDMGVSYAVVVRDVDDDALSSLFWANLVFGLALGVLLVALAPAVAAFYDNDDVTIVVLVLALVLPASALGSIPFGLAQKALAFDRIAKIDVAAAVVGLLVAVVAAAAGAGAVSLALGLVASSLLRSVLFVQSIAHAWRPSRRLRWDDIRPHVGFGSYQMGERTSTFFVANIDYLLIGRYLGTEALGYYSIAFQLIIRPLSQLNPVIMRVATPLFARKQEDDASLRRGFLEVTRLIALATFPLLAGLAVVAPVFVPVVLGDEWLPSVVLLQILAFVGILKALGNPLGAIVLAKDRPDLSFKLSLLMLFVTGGAIWAVVDEGTEAVAWAHLAAMGVGLVFAQTWALWRLISMRPLEYIRELALPAAITAGLAAAVAVAYEVSQSAGAGEAIVLAAATVVGTLLYLLLVRGFLPRDWAELRAVAAQDN